MTCRPTELPQSILHHHEIRILTIPFPQIFFLRFLVIISLSCFLFLYTSLSYFFLYRPIPSHIFAYFIPFFHHKFHYSSNILLSFIVCFAFEWIVSMRNLRNKTFSLLHTSWCNRHWWLRKISISLSKCLLSVYYFFLPLFSL